MEKLNYAMLETLIQKAALEITNVDVKRLRDDRSEIQIGEDVAFVATASFRLTPLGATLLHKLPGSEQIAVGDELLMIGADAELRSETIAIDEDSVALWLAERYTFTFLLNGEARHLFRDVGRVRVNTKSPPSHPTDLALPWLKKLNTASVKDDYIEVDVRIEENELLPPPPPEPEPTRWQLADERSIAFRNGEQVVDLDVDLEVDVEARPLHELVGKKFRLQLKHADDPEAAITLVLTVVDRCASKGKAPRSESPLATYKNPKDNH